MEREAWPALVERFQDKAWRQAGLQRDEKFEMHFNAAVRALRSIAHDSMFIKTQNATHNALTQAEAQLQSGHTGVELAHTLIDVSKDVLALALDKQVRV